MSRFEKDRCKRPNRESVTILRLIPQLDMPHALRCVVTNRSLDVLTKRRQLWGLAEIPGTFARCHLSCGVGRPARCLSQASKKAEPVLPQELHIGVTKKGEIAWRWLDLVELRCFQKVVAAQRRALP